MNDKFSLASLNDDAVLALNEEKLAAANREADAKAIEIDEAATVARLAALSSLKYAKERSTAAQELGIPVGSLDKAVREAKAASPDTKGQGRPLELPEVEPWPQPVNGAAAGLARMLGPFGIAPGTKRAGGDTFKGYLFSDFTDAFASYLADQTVTPSQLNNHGHCDALQTVTLDDDVTLSKVSQLNNHGHCDGVTLSNPDSHARGIPDPEGWQFHHDDEAPGDAAA